MTLVSGSIGEIVVDACIQKINSAAGIGTLLSNDFGFLKRLALVESNFGDSPANPLGGIWQVNQTNFFNSNIVYFANQTSACH